VPGSPAWSAPASPITPIHGSGTCLSNDLRPQIDETTGAPVDVDDTLVEAGLTGADQADRLLALADNSRPDPSAGTEPIPAITNDDIRLVCSTAVVPI
jgi:hypothetical protein